MRKFRGRTIHKMWAKGYYYATPTEEQHFILTGEERWLVEKETIGMCADTPDMYGNELYEGDIVAYEWNPACPPVKMVIRYKDDCFLLEPVSKTCPHFEKCLHAPSFTKSCELWDVRLAGESKKVKLMSNIYDLPSLLTK